MTDDQGKGKNGSVFISYSRKDKEFVRKLYDGLVANDVKAWVDWEGIPLSADWMDEITRAVNGADAFLVVLSPDWLASEVCAKELDLGLKSNKKLIPILYRAPEKGTTMHEKLAATNWVYMRVEDDFETTLPKLIDAINTDLEWVRQHTRLLGRAIEWNTKNRNPSFLLQGADLDEGERWMSESTKSDKRVVVPLQAEYLAASRKEAIRRQRMLLAGVSLALVVSVVLAILAIFQWDAAKKSEAKAVDREHARATQQVIAQQNEKLAKENEVLAKTNEQRAKDNEALAKANEVLARAQRTAAEAKLYQGKAGELDISTLLAIDSWKRSPSFQAQEILRQNLALLPKPVAQVPQGGRIYGLNFSPDGQSFVATSETGTACVWRLRDGQQQFCMEHEKGKIVYEALFSADGKWLATASADGSARLWNATDGKLVKRYDFEGEAWDVAFSPSSEWLVIAHNQGMKAVNLINPLQKDRDVRLPSPAHVLAYSADSQWVGIGTLSGQVYLWWTGSLYTSAGAKHAGEVLAITFTPDGQSLLSAGADSTARVTKTSSAKQTRVFRAGDWVEDIAPSPNGNWIVGAADDNRVWIWDLATGTDKMRLLHNGFVLKAKIGPNGQWIASTGFDQTLRVWDARSGSQMLQASLNGIGSALAISPDGARVVVGDREGQLSIWDVSTLTTKIGSIEFNEYVHEVKLSPDGKRLLANTDEQKVFALDFANLPTVQTPQTVETLFSTDGLTYDLEISPDSKWVAATESQNNRTVLYNFEQKTSILLEQGAEVHGVAFTRDSLQVATAGKDGNVFLWNTQTGEKQAPLENASTVLELAISPVADILVAGLDGRASTTVWDLKTHSKLAELAQSGDVNVVKFSPDGSLVATGDDLGVIKIWNARDFSQKEPVHTLQLNSKVLSMIFSPDQRWLVVGSADGYAQIFDVQTENEIARLPHVDDVTGLAFSQDGQRLFTVSRKIIEIWDVGKLLLTPTDKLVETACSRLVADLSKTEWEALFPTDPEQQHICPTLPYGAH